MYWIGHYILLFFSHFDILILFVFIICVVVVNNSQTILLTPPHTHEKRQWRDQFQGRDCEMRS